MEKLKIVLISFIILVLSAYMVFAKTSMHLSQNMTLSYEYDSSFNKNIKTIQINENDDNGLYSSYLKLKLNGNNIEDISIIWENGNFGYDKKKVEIEYSFDGENFQTIDCEIFYILAKVQNYKDFYNKMLNSKELILKSSDDTIKFDLIGLKTLIESVSYR